jgi:hypothetical protein
MGFSNRVCNALYEQNIVTLGQLVDTPRNKIKRIRNLGKISWKEIDEKLESLDLTLQPPLDRPTQIRSLKILCASAADALDKEAAEQETHFLDELIIKLRKAAI